MRYIGQRWNYREDKFAEIGTTDQLVTLNGEYSSIQTAVKYRFRPWADGKIIRILEFAGDSIYGDPRATYYLDAQGALRTVQPRPVYELENDWSVELFYTTFIGWGYEGNKGPMFYEPEVVYWKPDPKLDLVCDFRGKVPDLSDRGLHTKEFWRKQTWAWRATKESDFPLNWQCEDTPELCLLDALKWAHSQDYGSTSGWYYHGHYEPMTHMLQRIKVRTQDEQYGTQWSNFDMTKLPEAVAERISRIVK